MIKINRVTKPIKQENYKHSKCKGNPFVLLVCLVAIMLYLGGFPIHSQIITSIDSINKQVVVKNAKELSSELEEYKISKKYNWVYFLPYLGYDFIANRPHVTINISGISNLIRDNKKLKQKIKSLQKTRVIKVNQDLMKVKLKHTILNNSIEHLNYKIKLFKHYSDLFYIKKTKYKNKEITTEEYISEQIYIKEKMQSIYIHTERVHLLIESLQQFINSELIVTIPQLEFKL